MYREQNPNNNRCYIYNDQGHYANQCPRKGTQSPLPQQYSDQGYPQAPNHAPYYLPVQYPQHPPSQLLPVPEVCTILASIRNSHPERAYKQSQSRLLIQYEGDQENKGEMVPLATPTITKGGRIQKSGRANKTRPTIDRERLKALLESGTDNSGELMNTIEEMFQPENQVLPVQPQLLIPIDDNRQIPLTPTT